MSKICLLFDLDGTLVLTGGAGLRAFDRAFKEVFHVNGEIKSVQPAGRTDPDILREVCRLFLKTEPTPAQEREVFKRYLGHLRQEVQHTPDFQVMPGIQPLLETLRRNERCLLGLGTGNIKEGAEIKLTRPGLWEFFSFGGYGSDTNQRAKLLGIALERGKRLLGDGETLEAVYVIGDTPRDIQAGRAIGAQTVGVATGPYSLQELEAEGADFAYTDLSDYEAFLSRIGLA